MLRARVRGVTRTCDAPRQGRHNRVSRPFSCAGRAWRRRFASLATRRGGMGGNVHSHVAEVLGGAYGRDGRERALARGGGAGRVLRNATGGGGGGAPD
eukprot:680514-Prorocentrum_minimum.AAC.1